MNHDHTIETTRLLIRSVEMDDLDDLHTDILSDPALMGVGIYLGRPLTAAESKSFVEGMCAPRTDKRYISPSVMRLKKTQELIGFGGLSSETDWYTAYRTIPDRLDAELFYVFKKAHWGQGFATEMAKAVVSDAFIHRGVDRVWASIATTHKASQRVAEKAGLVLKKAVKDESEGDTWIYLYELTRDTIVGTSV